MCSSVQAGLRIARFVAVSGEPPVASTHGGPVAGQCKPSLELLLPLGETYRLPLDELVGAPPVGDPRVRTGPRTRNGRLVFPLTQQQSSGTAVWKVVIPERRGRAAKPLKGSDGFDG